jgi:16S rRNA (cytosine967-C5)-methyltransferase
MKLHRILVEAVIESLNTIFGEDRYADKVIEKVLKSNKKWGSRDRAFIAESVYDIVRQWRLLGFICEAEEKPLEQLWNIFGVWYLMKYGELPTWNEFKDIDNQNVSKKLEIAQKQRALKYSIPDWMDEIGFNELGERWETELAALNQTAPVILRTNTLKTTVQKLQQDLAKDGIETKLLADTPTALQLLERRNIFTSPYFQEGHFEIQDAGSQWIGAALEVQPGMRVIDACAGAGGKTLHISAMMENKGHLIALDTEAWKLLELKKRAKRATAHNIETRWIENNKVVKRLHETADRLLLDVPCSGLGVLRRNPDAKWKLKPEFIDNIRKTQREILESYPKMLRKGGKMVYATCSILPSENEEQVQWFLEQQKGRFELISEKRCSPAVNGYDGFYMAFLKRVK